jgi:hypothetical protein
MTDPTPIENSVSSQSRKLPSRKVLIIVSIIVALVAGVLGFSSWQASANLKAEKVRIENLIQKDDFISAKSAITEALRNNENDTDLESLEDQVEKLETSKSNFTEGGTFLLQRNYQSAITSLKKVLEADVNRYSDAQRKITEAESAYSLVVLADVERLKNQKLYSDALTEIERAARFILIKGELLQARVEITPLALAEKQKIEAAKQAVYRAALKSMRVQTDKFSGNKFYYDRSTPYYANYSTFNLYIGKSPDGDPYLRFKLRYSDDDWLFVNSASININGAVRDLDVGSDWERDNGSGDIWEWVDVPASSSLLSLIEDVINSKSSVVRFFGSQYRDDRVISSTQKRALRNVLNAYEALKQSS